MTTPSPRDIADELLALPGYAARLTALEGAPSGGDMFKTDNLAGLASNDTALETLGSGTGVGGGRAVFKAANAATIRALLELGTAALAVLGTSAGNLAPLDSGGKLPVGILPEAVVGAMKFRGFWNATTNIVTYQGANVGALPAAAAPNLGYYYIVTTAGTTSVNGINDWQVGDWAVSDGGAFDKIDSSDQVNSVGGLQGTITAANLRAALALVIGTNVQAWDTDLDAIAALAGNNKLLFRNAAGQWVVRGLGSGLTDDGTNIVGSGGIVLKEFQLNLVADGTAPALAYYASYDQTVTYQARVPGNGSSTPGSLSSVSGRWLKNSTSGGNVFVSTVTGDMVSAGVALKAGDFLSLWTTSANGSMLAVIKQVSVP